MGRPPKFSIAQDSEIAALYNAGQALNAIAALYAPCSQTAVRHSLGRSGVAIRPRSWVRERGTCVCGNPSYLASGTCRRCYDQRRNSDPAARERKLNWWLKKYFNLSRDTYDALLLAQNGVCAVCQRPDPRGVRLAVDHDHACCPGEKSCGKCIRGLLCVNCNRATGLLGDSVANTTRLLDYLARVRVV